MFRIFRALKGFKEDERGTLTYFIVFIFLVVILLVLFAFGIPLAIRANTEFYTVGEQLINESSATISSIQNQTIKQEIQNALNSAQQSTAEQIDILAWFFQYSWIWILLVITLVIFVIARRSVEYGTGGVR